MNIRSAACELFKERFVCLLVYIPIAKSLPLSSSKENISAGMGGGDKKEVKTESSSKTNCK